MAARRAAAAAPKAKPPKAAPAGSALNTLRAENQKLAGELDNLTTQHVSEIGVLKRQLAEAQADAGRVPNLEHHVEELNEQLALRAGELERYTRSFEEARFALNDARGERDTARRNLQAANDRIRQLEADLAVTDNARDEENRLYLERDAEVTTLNQQLREEQQLRQNAEAEVTRLRTTPGPTRTAAPRTGGGLSDLLDGLLGRPRS